MPNQSFPTTTMTSRFRFNPYAFPLAPALVVANGVPKNRAARRAAKGKGARPNSTSRRLKLQSREAAAAVRQRARVTAGNATAANHSRPRKHFSVGR